MDNRPTTIHTEPTTFSTRLRRPKKSDGAAVNALIAECKPLDENSMYCNLLQCDHFAETCVVAEKGGEIVGWVSGYVVPEDEETLFVWQVAVSPKARGESLARRMLEHLLKRKVCASVRQLQTTITEDNDASWALFTRFAERNDAEVEHETHFCKECHFEGEHDTERMVTIRLPEAFRKAA